jgi:hypothetical protein
MGVFLSLDELHRVLFVRFEGVVTDIVLLERFEQVREWFRIHGPVATISDFSDVSSFEVTAAGVEHLASSAPLVPDEYLRIVVAPQDESYGMSRMFEMMGSTTRNRVDIARTRTEAYKIAGIENPQPHPILYW